MLAATLPVVHLVSPEGRVCADLTLADGCPEVALSFDGKTSDDKAGEFRIGSVCTATIVPEGRVKDAEEMPANALEKLDHARGK